MMEKSFDWYEQAQIDDMGDLQMVFGLDNVLCFRKNSVTANSMPIPSSLLHGDDMTKGIKAVIVEDPVTKIKSLVVFFGKDNFMKVCHNGINVNESTFSYNDNAYKFLKNRRRELMFDKNARRQFAFRDANLRKMKKLYNENFVPKVLLKENPHKVLNSVHTAVRDEVLLNQKEVEDGLELDEMTQRNLAETFLENCSEITSKHYENLSNEFLPHVALWSTAIGGGVALGGSMLLKHAETGSPLNLAFGAIGIVGAVLAAYGIAGAAKRQMRKTRELRSAIEHYAKQYEGQKIEHDLLKK